MSGLLLWLYMLNTYHCISKVLTITFKILTFLFWLSYLRKLYQSVLESPPHKENSSMQSWKHCYCDVVCFHGSPLPCLQITSVSLRPWSHIIEGNRFDDVSAIERWVWLNNSEQWFHTDQSSVGQNMACCLRWNSWKRSKNKFYIVLWCGNAVSYTLGQTILFFRWSCFILNAQQINAYYLVVLWKVSRSWSSASG